ncbi:MAG: class I SAM-dependent methyltransferase [Bacillota bacterium]
MEEINNVETVYAYIDQVASMVEEKSGASYLEGINEALNLLLDHAMEIPLDLESEKALEASRQSMENRTFSKEDVRKGIQLALLKGFKTLDVTNAMMTPDSIGIFIAYLLKKLYEEDESLSVLDPLSGTGNLLATLSNHYEAGMSFTAIEADAILSKTTENFLDALDIEHKTLNQDTLAFTSEPFDLVVTDLPIESIDRKDAYFPYQIILHHLEHVKRGGYFIALIENNFFDQNEADDFKGRLLEDAHLFGLLKLDEGLFTNHPKSILILQRKMDKKDTMEQFLLADLPSFNDEEAMGRSIQKIDQWFKNRKVD